MITHPDQTKAFVAGHFSFQGYLHFRFFLGILSGIADHIFNGAAQQLFIAFQKNGFTFNNSDRAVLALRLKIRIFHHLLKQKGQMKPGLGSSIVAALQASLYFAAL